VKLTQFWQQLMLRLALIGAVLAVCVMWGGLVAPVSAESTASVPVVSLSPRSLNFGNQQVNTTSAVQTVTLTNTGNANLTIHSIGLSGTNSGDFRQQNTCPSSSSTLAAGDHCFIDVTFKPTAEGSRSASLTITDNTSSGLQSVALSGSGTTASVPVVSLSPRSLNFGNQQVNTTSAVQTVTLTNTSNANLTIHSIGLSGTNSGDFHQSNTCPSSSSTLAAGDSCTINVTFIPTAEGSRSASLTITDNTSSGLQSAALSGTGVVGMPPTGSDPNAQPPADNTQQVPLGLLELFVAFVAAAGIGTALISGRLRRSRPR
jgi:hypothetical protein